MRAAVIAAPGKVELARVDDPAPKAHEVVVAVAAVGLCGTDRHLLAGEIGLLPVIPGHEVSGTVVAVGAAVTDLRVGDRVVVDPNLPCRRCRWCLAGRENLCPELGALGISTSGGAAELMAAPATNCVKLPAHVDLEAATLIEPLSCALHACDLLDRLLGATVLLYGAGTMGLLLSELLRRSGATVDLIDTNPLAVTRAQEMGASAAQAAEDFPGAGVWDVVVDATGTTAALQDGLGRVERGGRFLVFGVTSPHSQVSVSPYDLYDREITLLASRAVLHSFGRAVALFGRGVIDPAMYLRDKVPLTDYALALARFADGQGLKTQVLPAANVGSHHDWRRPVVKGHLAARPAPDLPSSP